MFFLRRCLALAHALKHISGSRPNVVGYDMGVPFGCRHLGVAKHGLYGAQVFSFGQQVLCV